MIFITYLGTASISLAWSFHCLFGIFGKFCDLVFIFKLSLSSLKIGKRKAFQLTIKKKLTRLECKIKDTFGQNV